MTPIILIILGVSAVYCVGYVDDLEIVNYTNDTRQDQPTMQRFNQTAWLYVFQMMFGCELRDDGITAWYEQYGYDGRDLLYLDTQSRIYYIPTMDEAQITAQIWNSPEVREGERWKTYLLEECIDWLKTHINNGREDLERRNPDNDHQSNAIVIVIAVIAVLAAAIAGVTVCMRKRDKKPTNYQATYTSEANSDSTDHPAA